MAKKKLEENQFKESSLVSGDDTAPIVTQESPPLEAEDQTEFDQFSDAENEAQTPEKVKPKRAKWVWLGILTMLVISLIGAGIGYGSALNTRNKADIEQRQIKAATQFELGLIDLKENRLQTARDRFEYVLSIYPEYPGIDEQLKNVMLAIAQGQNGQIVSTPQPGGTPFTPIATKDTRSLKTLFDQAIAQLNAQDWQGLYNTVYAIRDIDPAYEPVLVDGLYYIALRNSGMSQIQAGNLEIGLYNFSLAQQLAPIDRDALWTFDRAIEYINAGSFWTVNWPEAVERFKQLQGLAPNLLDSSGFTVTMRYAKALEGYGDFMQQSYEWCAAVPLYEESVTIYQDPDLIARIPEAKKLCEKPPATPTPTVDPYAPTPTPTKKPKKN